MQPEFNSRQIKIVIGLGNPGKKYKNTYHNAGHTFIDYLEKNSPLPKENLLKSGVFMNDSGSYVASLVKKRKIARPEETLVVHDDSDLALGTYKFSFGRGAAGHKGIQSVIDALKTEDFWRLRIGIRKQESGIRQKAGVFVLKKITLKDKNILKEVFEKILPRLSA